MKKFWLLIVLFFAVLCCLAWPARARLILMRALGQVQVASACSVFGVGIFGDEERYAAALGTVREVRRDGGIALFETPIGSFWDRLGAWSLPALVQETEHDAYGLRSMVKTGDIVFDVGANVGATARVALAAGAAKVIAVEPEPVILECLRRNLAQEIKDGSVVVVPVGAWDREDTMDLSVDTDNAMASSLVKDSGGQRVRVRLTTIDQIVADLGLPAVNVIKMDIEGAEARALAGAAETIRRFRPRLTIALEHNVDDAQVLPALIRGFWKGYNVSLTPCTKTGNMIHPQTALLTP